MIRLVANDNKEVNHGPWNDKRYRAWAILYNDWPWYQKTVKDNDGTQCPAERINRKHCHDNRLQNPIVATEKTNHKTLRAG